MSTAHDEVQFWRQLKKHIHNPNENYATRRKKLAGPLKICPSRPISSKLLVLPNGGGLQEHCPKAYVH